jgi:hypothetical protein
MALSRVALPQVRRLAAVFYPLGHPMPYSYATNAMVLGPWVGWSGKWFTVPLIARMEDLRE